MLLEEIRKLNCDGCKLRTEHYLLSVDDAVVVCRCLRCGRLVKDVQFVAGNPDQAYPVDESRPIYVV